MAELPSGFRIAVPINPCHLAAFDWCADGYKRDGRGKEAEEEACSRFLNKLLEEEFGSCLPCWSRDATTGGPYGEPSQTRTQNFLQSGQRW